MCKTVTGKKSSKKKRGGGGGFRLRCGSGLCVGVRRARRVRQEWAPATAQFWGSFLCRLMGNTGAKVTIGGIPHLAGMGLPSFPSSLAGASMGHRVGSAQQGAVNQSVMGPAVGDPRG